MNSSETIPTIVIPIPDTSGPNVDVAFLVVIITVTLVAFFGNLGTISAFLTDSRVNTKPSDLMLLNLACVDFSVSVFVMPLELITDTIIGRWPLGEIGCRIMVPINMTLLTAGIMSVILISFDRYQMLALDYSKYVKKWNVKNVKRLIIIAWIVSLGPGVFETLTWDITMAAIKHDSRPNFEISCSQPSSWRLITNVVCVIFVAIIPTTVVSALGVLIIFKLQQRLQRWRKVGYDAGGSTVGSTVTGTVSQIKPNVENGDNCADGNVTSGTTADSNGRSNSTNHIGNSKPQDLIRKRYIKPIITYLSLSACLAICTFPICTYAILLSSDFKYYNPVLLKYLICLMYSVSCWNPVLYGLTNSKIRDYYKKHINAVVKNFRS